ncbi:hypothetical protein GQ457_05G015010 [Hibiscus cannabinus]
MTLDDVRMNLEVLKHCAIVLIFESSLPTILNASWQSSPKKKRDEIEEMLENQHTRKKPTRNHRPHLQLDSEDQCLTQGEVWKANKQNELNGEGDRENDEYVVCFLDWLMTANKQNELNGADDGENDGSIV